MAIGNTSLMLNKLSIYLSILEDYDSNKVAIIGDFNAAADTTFERELLELCTHHKLIVSVYEYFGRTCRSSQFTFVSDAHSVTSCLDHIICSFNVFCILSYICVLDN